MSTPASRGAEHTPLLASQLALIEAVRADVAALRAGGAPVPREAALDATANDLVGARLVIRAALASPARPLRSGSGGAGAVRAGGHGAAGAGPVGAQGGHGTETGDPYGKPHIVSRTGHDTRSFPCYLAAPSGSRGRRGGERDTKPDAPRTSPIGAYPSFSSLRPRRCSRRGTCTACSGLRRASSRDLLHRVLALALQTRARPPVPRRANDIPGRRPRASSRPSTEGRGAPRGAACFRTVPRTARTHPSAGGRRPARSRIGVASSPSRMPRGHGRSGSKRASDAGLRLPQRRVPILRRRGRSPGQRTPTWRPWSGPR